MEILADAMNHHATMQADHAMILATASPSHRHRGQMTARAAADT